MNSKKDIFNNNIVKEEVGRIKFTIIFVPIILLFNGIVLLCSSLFYADIEAGLRSVVYIISLLLIFSAIVYPIASIALIRCYPKHSKLACLFIRKEFFKY